MNTTADLQLFNFEGAEVRAFAEADGVPWFVAADICALLGHSNTSRAVRDLLDDDQWRTVPAGRLDPKQGEPAGRVDRKQAFQPGAREFVVVDESGLYGLILGSRVPGAKPFRRWVTREVIPAIRRRGVYAVPEVNRELAEHATAIRLGLDTVLEYDAEQDDRAIRADQMSAEQREASLRRTRALVDLRRLADGVASRFPFDGPVRLPETVATLPVGRRQRAALGGVVSVDPWT